jgi:hypothetical protein
MASLNNIRKITTYGTNMRNYMIYLVVSADPVSPVTNEKRTAIGVFFPTSENTTALVYCVMSCVTSKKPNAPVK